MRRWHQETHITYRNWQNHINSHRESNKYRGKSPEDTDCTCKYQTGRFRKKDGYDCGNSQCYICHSDKLLGEKSLKEIIADFNFREQINEYFIEPSRKTNIKLVYLAEHIVT